MPTSTQTLALQKELETYRRELPTLLTQEGKYVLIHEEKVSGVWDTYEDALKAGYQEFGLKPFMVKRIQWAETVQNFSRDILCHPSTSR